jgi:peptidoglycan/xylan/chitin deacetylase (PgdA/CDA1 family)/LysM repeat protein
MRTSRLTGLLALLLALSACAAPAATPGATPTVGQPGGGTFSPLPSTSGDPGGSPTPSVGPTVTPATGTTYTVKAGDSLSSIARAFATSSRQLQAWNADRYPSLSTNPGIIEPGWVLIVSGDAGVTPLPTPAAPPATPTPPPSGFGCSANQRVSAGSAQTFRTIPGAGPGVALTFDMGGRMDPAVDIMNFLVDHEVCATIFATGVMSQTAEGRRVMAIIRDHPQLFEIANHTMYHCDLARGGGGSPTTAPCAGTFDAARIRAELTDAEAILRDGTGQSPQPYWRPPYGSLSQAVIDAAAAAGYTKTFLWDVDTIDWKPISQGGPTAAQIAAKVINNAVNGSNVLFHLGGYETLDALQLIVPGLRDRGFTLTSLSDLLN